jgi:predicted homoserine dehydrogenase-like protein
MIIVDRVLREREATGRPIRVGLVGAGFMGGGIARQIIRYTPGMELACIVNRHPEKAKDVYRSAGQEETTRVETPEQLQAASARNVGAVTSDPAILCAAEGVDAIIEATGTVEYAARVAADAIEHRKHVVSLNAELDGTLGPILAEKARRAGVVYTGSDGDQPGVTMNLYRFVRGIGAAPIVCGNIKGFHDPYRTPETQAEFARKWGQQPHMVTSFADGTKVSFEQAVIANATEMRVAVRGMYGPTVPAGTPIERAMSELPLDDIADGGPIVDYIVGPAPAPGVFVVATYDDPVQSRFLELYKLGKGPFYCFYRPYHLCHFEVPSSVARAVEFGDPTLVPVAGPRVDVVAAAKRDLDEGETLDGLGHFMTYGLCENTDVVDAEGLLRIGLAEGCRLARPVEKDEVLTASDVEFPPGRLADALLDEQRRLFSG